MPKISLHLISSFQLNVLSRLAVTSTLSVIGRHNDLNNSTTTSHLRESMKKVSVVCRLSVPIPDTSSKNDSNRDLR